MVEPLDDSGELDRVTDRLGWFADAAVATPMMGLGTDAGTDQTLLDITARIAPFLALPLAVSAVLSQFRAPVADTAATIALAATVNMYVIVAIASRAFAVFYATLATIALRTSNSVPKKVGYGALAAVMCAIALFAQPAG